MALNNQSLFTPVGIAIDLVLTVCFFTFMSGVVADHIPLPADDYPLAFPIIQYLTTACVSAVFWLALGCFRATFKDQRQRKQTSS